MSSHAPSATSAMRVVFDEERIVVVDKEPGVTSEDVARILIRKLVHRIDKETSGLLMLADDARTATRLQRALRSGGVERVYRFVANGAVMNGHRETVLVRDRGDGLRGTPQSLREIDDGKDAAMDIACCEAMLGGRATRGEARLITGRTHQIRIQLAESGHPIVGERVYVRDARAAGMILLESPRLLLHAAELRFVHPNTKKDVVVTSALPVSFSMTASTAH